ncbi:MAG: cell envelope integrity protein TolA [Sulfuriferula sp.]|nr:cell envelope integrity protein TolA [Sulfuriferula sp.]
MYAMATPTSGRLPAAVLAVLVHLLFFALLVYSLDWKTHAPEPVMVELWQPQVASYQPPPKVVKQVEKVSKPEPVQPNPDIALADKKRKLAEQAAQLAAQKQAAQKLAQAAQVKAQAQQLLDKKLVEQKITEQKQAQQAKADVQKQQAQKQAALRQLIAQQSQTELKNESARALVGQKNAASASKQAADMSKMQNEYVEKIKAKIRGKIILPDSLQGNPQARFAVSLLPTGEVLQVKLLRGSGQSAYDDAVERAILKASPLPMPPDASLMAQFRELDLKFAKDEK